MKNLVSLLNSFNKIFWKKRWHQGNNFKLQLLAEINGIKETPNLDA